jgi:DNA repair protein RadB
MALLDLLRPPAPKAATVPRLPTGCAPLDALLGGGIEGGALTEVHGEAGAGKTNLCLQLAAQVARAGGRALYLDSEGFSPERLAQVAGPDLALVQRALLVERLATPMEQAKAAARAARIAKLVPEVRLVVVDSATLLYRVALAEGAGVAERRALLRQLHGLHGVARSRGIAVVVTNQVFSLPGEDGLHALGGHALRHLAACVLRLERGPAPGVRIATLVKHRARPEGLQAGFRLGSRGLESPEAAEIASPRNGGDAQHMPRLATNLK